MLMIIMQQLAGLLARAHWEMGTCMLEGDRDALSDAPDAGYLRRVLRYGPIKHHPLLHYLLQKALGKPSILAMQPLIIRTPLVKWALQQGLACHRSYIPEDRQPPNIQDFSKPPGSAYRRHDQWGGNFEH